MSQENNDFIQKFFNWKDLGNWIQEDISPYSLQAKNPLCGDEVILYVKRENDFLTIISLGGDSCSICNASTGLLFSQKVEWNKNILADYLARIEGYLNDLSGIENLKIDETEFWSILKKHPNRYRCALLPYVALGKGF